MTFRHCSYYELSGDERTTIAKMITILTELESELDFRQSEAISDGAFNIITASQIDEIADTLQTLLDQDEEEVYFN